MPLVIVLIFLILYWTYHDLADAALMLLAGAASLGHAQQNNDDPPAPGTRGVGGLSSTKTPARSLENPLLLSGLALAGANRGDA